MNLESRDANSSLPYSWLEYVLQGLSYLLGDGDFCPELAVLDLVPFLIHAYQPELHCLLHCICQSGTLLAELPWWLRW